MMKFKKSIIVAVAGIASLAAAAQSQGGIDAAMLERIKGTYENNATDKALRNAIHNASIDVLALNSENANAIDDHFSVKVSSSGITDQKSSGRCWAFTGLNVVRAKMMQKNDMPTLTLSPIYLFFYDQLEKSNLFLQSVIDTADKPIDDTTVDWLFANPLSDGGTYSGVADLIMKYGVVPESVMHETTSSNNTSKIRQLISLKLREQGLALRDMKANKANAKEIAAAKEQMLGEVYRMLALAYGVPPTEFEWTRRDISGDVVNTKTYTPQSFYAEYMGDDLLGDYVMLMNDPSRPYYKLYEIDLDRHMYDGHNWKYVNMPIEDIKDAAIKSLQDTTMMYFSCDVAKYFDRSRGLLDIDNYDYESLFGVTFGMDKAQRIQSHASASSHAMTLMAVDLNDEGQPTKWMVENSWGPGVNSGHLIMTDKWFDEYMFRLAVNKKYLPQSILDVLKQKPILLPPWDPLFCEED